ncbi:MAG: hypothetical protein Q8L48_20575 [Archangium sp.]|nr:hypothetical protein [Archangium sp.]
MASLSLLYLPTSPPQRGRYALDCQPHGAQWEVWPPGHFTCRGEVFEPEPVFVDEWLRAALAPFGATAGDGYYVLDEPNYRAFLKSLKGVVSTDAYTDARRMVEVFPGDALLRLERAQVASRQGKPRQEIDADIAAALAMRTDAETLLAASYALTELDREGALRLLAQAVAREPGHEVAARQYLLLLDIAGRLDELLAVDEAHAATRPRDDYRWWRRGEVLQRLGRLEEAVDAMAQSLALKDSVMRRAARGTLLEKLGRDDEALRELDASLPGCAHLDGHLARADVLLRRGDLEGAEKTLRWLAHAPSHRDRAEERLRRLAGS